MKVVRHCIEDNSDEPLLFNIDVKIYDPQGHLIVASKNASPEINLSTNALSVVLSNHDFLENRTVRAFDMKQALVDMRILSMPTIEEGQVAYIVQVATSMHTLTMAFDHLKMTLLVFLPITVILTGIVGTFLAKMALMPVKEMTNSIRHIKDGHLNLRISVPDTKDEVEKLARTFNDMLEDMEHLFDAQKQFIQDASHEIKTPLTVLRGEIDIALKKDRPVSEYQAILKSAREETDTMSAIIERLLLLAKLGSQRHATHPKSFSLAELIDEVCRELKILAELKAIGIQIKSLQPVVISADPSQVKVMLVNLIENAIKYNVPQGHIIIEIFNSDTQKGVSITDTGIGMSGDDLSHIFDRFYRADKSRHTQGFGLGLSIAKAIAVANGARIDVKSVLGQGSTFTILFS